MDVDINPLLEPIADYLTEHIHTKQERIHILNRLIAELSHIVELLSDEIVKERRGIKP